MNMKRKEIIRRKEARRQRKKNWKNENVERMIICENNSHELFFTAFYYFSLVQRIFWKKNYANCGIFIRLKSHDEECCCRLNYSPWVSHLRFDCMNHSHNFHHYDRVQQQQRSRFGDVTFESQFLFHSFFTVHTRVVRLNSAHCDFRSLTNCFD